MRINLWLGFVQVLCVVIHAAAGVIGGFGWLEFLGASFSSALAGYFFTEDANENRK